MKKPGLNVAIVAGGAPKRPAPKSDLSGLGPLDGPPPKKAMPHEMSGGEPEGDEPEDGPSPDHEAAESPDYESSEEQGAKLISDIEQAGEKHGLDGAGARAFAADVFRAMAECLAGGGEGGEQDEGQAPPMMGGGPYGR